MYKKKVPKTTSKPLVAQHAFVRFWWHINTALKSHVLCPSRLLTRGFSYGVTKPCGFPSLSSFSLSLSTFILYILYKLIKKRFRFIWLCCTCFDFILGLREKLMWHWSFFGFKANGTQLLMGSWPNKIKCFSKTKRYIFKI